MSRLFPRGCKLFRCDRRHGYFCCADCGYRTTGCKDYCENNPGFCGQALPQRTQKTKEEERLMTNILRTYGANITPEQAEMALYEGAVEIFGRRELLRRAAQGMAELCAALIKLLHAEVSGREDGPALREETARTRAGASLLLNQLDVLLGDNSEAELDCLQRLAEQLEEETTGEESGR